MFQSYRLRLRRKRFKARAFLKRRELEVVSNKTQAIGKDDILCVITVRNERVRLPYFLTYYRALGINHFLFIDNGSDDGTRDYLCAQNDVSLWYTESSYREARYGVDWVNWLLRKYAHKRWALTVDADEFFVYPFCDTRPLRALTDWLEGAGIKSFGAMLLDMYPKGPVHKVPYREEQDPFEIAAWFDSGNYTISQNQRYGNLWVQGGPRTRKFFSGDPFKAPSLNKVPLIKWDRRYVYMSSTHFALPRDLNQTYDTGGGEKTSGVLLHAKFLDTFAERAKEEAERGEHYRASREYQAYVKSLQNDPVLWCDWSEKYINWRQLEILGLMSKGNWA